MGCLFKKPLLYLFHPAAIGLALMSKYDTLKVIGVVGTAFSFYRAFAESVPVDDIILILIASLLFITIVSEFEKAQKRAGAVAAENENSVAAEIRKQLEAFEEKMGAAAGA